MLIQELFHEKSWDTLIIMKVFWIIIEMLFSSLETYKELLPLKKNKYIIDIKISIIPFIILSLIFFIISHFIINGITNYYYEHMEVDALRFAQSYSHSLTKAAEATGVVSELLEEKMLVAIRTAALYDERYSNELLEELAETLEVDEIDYYNSQGEVVYSNINEFVGWKTYEGHPVYDFMNSNSISLVEDIRQDTITGNHYKYGYFKVSDGGFVQIGILADNIYSFLDGFEMQQLLDEMQDVRFVTHAYFIDNDFIVIGSTDNRLIGQEMVNQEDRAAIIENREYGFINNNKEGSEYEVFVPVYLGEKKLGTLAIRQSLRDTEAAVKQISIISLVTLLIIYALLFYIIISTYKKNRKLIESVYYDTLTGLPNNQYLKEFLTEEIEKKEENEKALLLINYSNFKIINLTYGYEYGDKLLKELSREIQVLVDGGKELYRFTADKFVLYVKDYHGQEDLVSITNRINEIFNDSFKLQDGKQNLGMQIGIVEINRKYDNVDRIIKNASISLSYIKDNGSVNYAFFNEVMESRIQREELIEKELSTAIANNDSKKIYLEFQPQVNLKTNQVTCFEALARMRTESLGFISPVEFIEIAERKQLIVPLGNLVLKTACEFINTLKIEGYGDIKVAVNVSGIQLLRDDFTDTVMDIIKETGIKESNLELEITESMLLDNYGIINEKLKILSDHNIAIALDDFGTGFSSLSRLRGLNIDIVKIDKYFINHISNTEIKESITGDIISMAHKLGLTVVAEGVEVEAEKDYLIENDCDIMQGYLFSKPLSKENVLQILKKL